MLSSDTLYDALCPSRDTATERELSVSAGFCSVSSDLDTREVRA